MAATCAETYPTLRLHLYDGRHTFAAPFTVFGRFRAALYLGEAYLVVTSAEQVAALTRLFDNLVRRAVVGPERVQDMLYELADGAEPADRRRESAPSPSVLPGPLGRAAPAPPPGGRFTPAGSGAALRALDRRLYGVPGSSAPRYIRTRWLSKASRSKRTASPAAAARPAVRNTPSPVEQAKPAAAAATPQMSVASTTSTPPAPRGRRRASGCRAAR